MLIFVVTAFDDQDLIHNYRAGLEIILGVGGGLSLMRQLIQKHFEIKLNSTVVQYHF